MNNENTVFRKFSFVPFKIKNKTIHTSLILKALLIKPRLFWSGSKRCGRYLLCYYIEWLALCLRIPEGLVCGIEQKRSWNALGDVNPGGEKRRGKWWQTVFWLEAIVPAAAILTQSESNSIHLAFFSWENNQTLSNTGANLDQALERSKPFSVKAEKNLHWPYRWGYRNVFMLWSSNQARCFFLGGGVLVVKQRLHLRNLLEHVFE